MSSARPYSPATVKLMRYGRAMSYAAFVLAVALPVLGAWALVATPVWRITAELAVPVAEVPMAARFGVGAVVLVPAALMSLGLVQLGACFRRIADGAFLALDVVSRLRRFAGYAVASAIAAMLATPVASAWLTSTTGKGQLIVDVSSGQLSLLFVAGATWLVAALIERGAQAATELEAIV